MILRFLTLLLDFKVLFLFCKGSLFFMIVKSERAKIENKNTSRCDIFFCFFTLAMMFIYFITLILRGLYAPLPLFKDSELGDDLFEDVFRFMIEPAVDFMIAISLAYLFYHVGKSS